MNLNALLETNKQELLRILQYLEKQSGPTKKQQLCQGLGISLKSLRSQIKLIQNNYSKEIYLVNDSHEVTLAYTEDMSLDLFTKQLIKDSLLHKLLESLFLDKNINFPDLQAKLFLSESGLKRNLKRLKDFLALHGISLRGLKIIGAEDRIRSFTLAYINQIYSVTERPFNERTEVEAYLELILAHVNRTGEIIISEYNANRLRTVLYISYFRSLQTNAPLSDIENIIHLSCPNKFLDFEELTKDHNQLPPSLLNQKEFSLLTHFLLNIPLISFYSSAYEEYFLAQKKRNTFSFQLFEYSSELLEMAFKTVNNYQNFRKLELLLFSINVNALFFSDEMAIDEVVGNRLNETSLEVSQPSISLTVSIVEQVNQFLEQHQIDPVDVNYLVNHYGFIIIQSSFYSDEKIPIGIFLANDTFQAKVSYDYFVNNLQFRMIIDFFDLLEKEVPCDFLITNDFHYAKVNREKYQDVLIVSLDQVDLDIPKINDWLHYIYNFHLNLPYKLLIQKSQQKSPSKEE